MWLSSISRTSRTLSSRYFAVILLLTFFWAVAADAARPATMSALTVATPLEQRKAAIALNRLAINLGMSIGPAVGGFLALVSFPLLFVVDGLTSLTGAFASTFSMALIVGPWLGVALLGRLGAPATWSIMLLFGLAAAALSGWSQSVMPQSVDGRLDGRPRAPR